MIGLVKRYFSASVLKVFSYTAAATIIKMVTGFVSIKIVALLVGVRGLAMLGQLTNFTSIVLVLASGGISNGITKYIAEYSDLAAEQRKYISNACYIVIFFSLLSSIIIFFGATTLSSKILFDGKYYYVFVIFSFTLVFYSINNLLISVLNGFKEFKKYAWVNISSSVIGLIFTVFLVYLFRLPGVLVSTVTFQSISVLVTIMIVFRLSWFKIGNFISRVDYGIIKKYLHFSVMAFVTAVTIPVSQILIRNKIIQSLSIENAGWWEGMTRLSSMYLMIITSSFSVYYLPKLSEINNRELLRREVMQAYKTILPLLLIGLLLIYLFKTPLILILFSKEFLPMRALFLWQVWGDFFKIATWIIGFIFVAKALTYYYVVTEILFSIVLVLLSFFLMHIHGLKGAMEAYAITYSLAFVFMIILFKKIIRE